jgi:DNA processing protein
MSLLTDTGQIERDRIARAGLSRCCEPEDSMVAVCVGGMGAVRVWDLVQGARATGDERQAVAEQMSAEGRTPRHGADLGAALQRWRSRAGHADPQRDLAFAATIGGGFIIPSDPGWPTALDDLGPAAPLGLWWRGPGVEHLSGLGAGPWSSARLLAVIGTRDPSPYGLHVTRTWVPELCDQDVCVLSGGALGIDIAAHRAALDHGRQIPATMTILASGIDQLYPARNSATLSSIGRHHLILTEFPPGSSPTRWRFLARNRLIAALGCGTLVVEGRWRSGALNTANRAASVGRWVGAVPGPITSEESELPHRLIREAGAELVTTSEDVLEAMGWTASAPGGTQDELPLAFDPDHPVDDLDPIETRVWESLPVRQAMALDAVLVRAGLATAQGIAALQRLAVRGAVREVEGGAWRRA